MKKFIDYVIMFSLFFTLASCSDDNNNINPFAIQPKTPFYPTALTFRSINAEQTETVVNWSFTYNTDNTINTYTYKKSVKGNNIDINEEKQGELFYYVDYDGNNRIRNSIVSTYTSTTPEMTYTHSDTITEDAKFSGKYITSIEITGKRDKQGTLENISNLRSFNYAGDFCTSSIYRDNDSEKTYSYKWSKNMLTNVTVYDQNKKNSNLSHENFEYKYNPRDIANDYGFNTLAFIYNHNPEIYDAMGFFGKATPFTMEEEYFSSYVIDNGTKYDLQSERHTYSIHNTNSSIIYTADPTPNYSEYLFNFIK